MRIGDTICPPTTYGISFVFGWWTSGSFCLDTIIPITGNQPSRISQTQLMIKEFTDTLIIRVSILTILTISVFSSWDRYCKMYAATCTVPKVIDFPRYEYNTKCSGENEILRGIFRVVSRFPLHFMSCP